MGRTTYETEFVSRTGVVELVDKSVGIVKIVLSRTLAADQAEATGVEDVHVCRNWEEVRP